MINRSTRIILAIGLVCLLTAAAWPPWRLDGPTWAQDGKRVFGSSAGRALIHIGPGTADFSESESCQAQIDAGRLLCEIAMIVALTGLAVCVSAGRSVQPLAGDFPKQ